MKEERRKQTEGVTWASRSTIEYEPTDFVAQLLVIKHEVPYFARKLCTLPLTFKEASFFGPIVRCHRTHGFDRVSRRTEFVCGYMRHHRRLTGRKCGVPGGSVQLSCRSHGMASRRASLRHRDLAARPCASRFDGSTRPLVIRLHFLE
jgi:hypothetical protein